MGVPISLDDIPDELLPGDPIPLDDIPDDFAVDEPTAPTAGPLRGSYLAPPVVLSELGPLRSGYAAPPSVLQERPQRVSQPRPENAPRDMATAFTPYGDYFSKQHEGAPLPDYDDSLGSDVARRASELFIDPIVRGYQQTAQASNVFTGDTAVESLESAAHDIAAREKQMRAAAKPDYMVEAEAQVKEIVQNIMTPDQIQRQYERRQYQDDLENGVDPRPFIPHPGYPGEAEQRQAEADLASAFGGDVQVQQKEYNLPGDPPGMPPVIGLTDAQKAEAIARMTGVYVKDPRRAINVSLESLTASGTGLALGFGLGAAGGSVAGVPGAVGGAALGAGTGSFMAEYGADVLDQMRQDGIDISNEQVVLRLLSDPAYMERVKEHALKRGVAVAAFDAAAAGLGGRVAGPVQRALEDVGKVSSNVGRQGAKIGGEAAEILAQGGLGGGGEIAGARFAGDEVDPEAVVQELIGEAGSGGAEVLSGRYNDQRAEEAYRHSPEGRADATRESALSSALDLTARIKASSPPAGTMPAPALTGSRASDAAGGTGSTAPIPPAAQGTAPTPEQNAASLASALAQMQPGPDSAAAKAKGALFDSLVAEVRKQDRPKQKQLAALSSKLREPTPQEPEKTEAEQIASASTGMQKRDTAGATTKVASFGDLLANLDKPLPPPAPPPNAAPPAPPAPTEPAPTPAPAEKAVSTTQEPPAGGAASTSASDRIVRVKDVQANSAHADQAKALKDGHYTEVPSKGGPVRLVHMQDDSSGTITAFDSAGKPIGFMEYSLGMAQPHASIIPERRRQGISTAMYELAEKAGANIPPADAPGQKRTQEGQAFREALDARKSAAPSPAVTTEPTAEEPAPIDEDTEEEERKKSVADEKAKHKAIKKEYKALRASDPEFNRIADFVGEDPQYADLGMLKGWKDAKAGVTIDADDARTMLPTSDMKPHGFNPVQRYLTGYAAALGMKPHDLRSFDTHEWLSKIVEAQTGETVTPAPAAEKKAAPATVTSQPKPKAGLFTGAHPILTDRREQVVTPGGMEVETSFEVVEAADLISSDKPNFPKQLQPRKRERKTSEDQVRHIIANFDPAQVGPSRLASHGAPIIGMDDNYVESGNGRVMAIRRVYENNPEIAARYRKYVKLISGVDVSKMKAPVLVRRRQTEMTDEQRVKWTREANKDVLMQMSASEKAAVDQEKLTPAVMSELPENMDEPLKLVEGKGLEFVEKFVAQFTPAERGELIDADGKVSSIALTRAKAALLQKAYGGTPAGDAAIRRASESTDTDAQSLVTTLMRFAAPFAQLKDDIASGRVQEQADIGPQIAEAVEAVRAAGSPGAVTRWLNTESLLEPKDPTVKQLIQTFYTFDGRGDAKRLRSAAAIGDTLAGYLKIARQHTPASTGGGLFGDDETAVLNPAAELVKLNAGRKEQEQQRERQEIKQRAGQGGLFNAGGKPSAAASPRSSDERGGEEAQPAGFGESRDTGDAQAPEETDEEITDLDDDIGTKAADSGVESAMDDTDEALADDVEEDSGIEEGRHERKGEKVPLPSTSRENLMIALNIKPEEFRAMGGDEQWRIVRKAIMDRFGFADILLHKGQAKRNAVDHLLDAFESLDNLASVMGAGVRIASLNGRVTLHMREKPGRTKGYFRYKPDGAEPGNTIAIFNQEDVYSHELAHAIDYHLMEVAGGAGPGGLTAMIRKRENTGKLPNTMLQAMADVYAAIYNDGAKIAALIHKAEHQLLQAKTPSERKRFQDRLDKLRNGAWRGKGAETDFYKRAKNGPMSKYLSKPTEFFARVFEAYISHKIQGHKDMGLVKFLGATDAIYSDTADAWIKRVYPHGAERQRIFATLDNLVGQIAREDIYNVGTQSPGIQQSHVNLGLIDPVAQAKANGTPLTPDIIKAHNLTNKAAMTFLEDEVARNDSMLKNFEQLVDDLLAGREDAAERLNAAMSKFASTPDTVFQYLEMRFPNIRTLRTIRNQLSDAHIAGRNKPVGFYREWQRTEHSITNDLEDRMKAVGVARNMPKDQAEHFWDVVHGLAKPKNAAVERQVDQFVYELARLWKLRDKMGEEIGFVDERYTNRVFMKDVADNDKFHADLLRLRVQEKNDLIVKLQAQRLATTDPAEIARLKAAISRAQAIDPMAATRSQIAKMKGLSWGQPVYLGAATEDSAKERVFGPAADEILKDWYVKDPATLLQMYGSAAARGIASRRRFGDDPNKVFQDWLDRVALELPAAYGELLKNAMEVSMGFRRDSHGSFTRMVNGAANVTTASMLGRAVFPNISEPLNIFGRGLSVPVTFGALMKATVPFMTSAGTRQRFATADRFGRVSGALVDAASSSTAMAQHIGEDTLGNGILARFSVRAYWFNFMSSLTAMQQKAMNRVGFELFYHVAKEVRKGGPGAELYRQWFREHGITDPDAFAKFLEHTSNIDSIDVTSTLFPGMALALANASAQLIHTNIQHPTPSTKHLQANRGVIGVIFRLTSWMTTNFINTTRYVKNRMASAVSGHYGGEEIHLRHRLSGDRAGQKLTGHERVFGRIGGTKLTVGQRVNAMAVTAATVATTMYAAQAFFVVARMMLTNGDEWEDRGDDFWDRFTSRKTQLQILQYWGIMGWMMNTAVDAVEGTRYNRGIAGSLAGPAYGGWEQDAERLMMGAVSLADQVRGEKDVSQAVKNNAAQAAYHIGSTIFSVGLLNVLRTRGFVPRAAGFAWSVIGTSPWAQHSFADMVAGKKDAELKEDDAAGDIDATDELNQREIDKAAQPSALDLDDLGDIH